MESEQEQDYLKLLNGLGEVLESTKGTQTGIDYRVLDAEGLVVKVLYHCCSAFHLSKGTIYPPLNQNFLEPASINVLIRAALESFLVFNYIFASSDDKDLIDLRYWAWKLSGLLEKQGIDPLTSKGNETLAKECDDIEDLRKNIIHNSIFLKLTERQQQEILIDTDKWRISVKDSEGNWKRPGWVDLAISSGLSESNSRDIYRYMCQYAHATSWCIEQIWMAQSNDDKERLIDGSLSSLLIIMACMIESYMKVFPKAKPVIEGDPELKRVIDIYLYVGSTDKSDYQTDWDDKFEEYSR
ncbi:MAG: DUF5677 domain-containing protein [Candidatus Hatepunaea meridiana]|nr:DUF5677 domain-containing protein [Candidatus Hatepunaea meridiana]